MTRTAKVRIDDKLIRLIRERVGEHVAESVPGDAMTVLAGLTLLYLIPGVIAAALWLWPVRRLINLWVGRDVMLGFIPKAKHVHHTERLLGIRNRP